MATSELSTMQLIAGLKSPDWAERFDAVCTLGQMGKPARKAVPALRRSRTTTSTSGRRRSWPSATSALMLVRRAFTLRSPAERRGADRPTTSGCGAG